jgi:hypothetical protein
VVHNRRNEIDGLDQGHLGAQAIYAGVIGGLAAHEKIWVFFDR